MTTRLTDLVINPEVFAVNSILYSLDLNAFIRSGIASNDPALNTWLNGPDGGPIYSPRFMGPLAADMPDIANDDPDDHSTPGKITSIKNTAVRQSYSKSWGSMDLTAALNGLDPMGAIERLTGEWWTRVSQNLLLLTLRGIIARNIASEGSDMTVDISTSGSPSASNLINAEAMIDAIATMGDRGSQFTAIAVHSNVLTTMEKVDTKLLDSFVPQSVIPGAVSSQISYRTFRGRPIIVDDGMTYADGKYYTYIFQPGAVALGTGSPRVPVAVQRIETAGNGSGQEVLHNRRELVIHPQGYICKLTDTPTPAQLIDPANWERTWERKRVGIACLISNG